MRFGSVCSGIEAASVAWSPLGWKAAWFSEIEPFPSAVLAHHYPSVQNLGDMTALPDLILSNKVEAPDILCGGTPCQAFSVAGLRRSLDDARGNLSLTFCEIANAIDAVRRLEQRDPCIIFWENVPGVLNTKDNAFGCFLAGLAGEDDALQPPGERWTDAGCVFGPTRAVAWRVLDAQYFGLAQRRKRVFVVASAREGFDPTSVLFEFQGVRRDTAPSREARQEVAKCLTAGTGKRFDAGTETLPVTGAPTEPKWWDGGDVAATLTVNSNNQRMPDKENAQFVIQSVANTIDASYGAKWGSNQWVDQGHAIVQPVTYDLFNVTAPINKQNRTPGDPCHTLARSNAEHAVAVYPLDMRNAGRDPEKYDDVNRQGVGVGQDGDPAHTVTSAHVHAVAVGCLTPELPQRIRVHGTDGTSPTLQAEHGRGHGVPTIMAPAVAVGTDCYNGTITGDVAATMGTPGSSVNASGPTVLTSSMAVRRLTPVECERLQGFPDNYTAIPWRNKPAAECPDGPRYKALGNSWAVPVVRWIGDKIDHALDRL